MTILKLRLLSYLKKTNNKNASSQIKKYLLLLFAASILAAIAYFFISYVPSFQKFETPIGIMDSIQFADNTKIILGPASSIEFNPTTINTERNFNLSGQAYIIVPTKGPLSITTSFGKVEVTGTEFEINDYAQNESTVFCYEGSVNVFSKNIAKFRSLKENEGVKIADGQLSDYRSPSTSNPEWIKNSMTFDNVPMSKVAETLMRYYLIDIDLSKVQRLF